MHSGNSPVIRRLFPPFDAEPATRRDKQGEPFSLHLSDGGEGDLALLLDLYHRFEPKGCAQGIPPRAEGQRRQWVERLLAQGLNLLASRSGKAVGHAALLDLEPGRTCEYLVFVHQDLQDRGIGTTLTQAARTVAKDLGYAAIWLTVEVGNPRAIHVYEKSGFHLTGPRDAEREMVAELRC